VVHLELRQVFIYTTFGYGYIAAKTRGINMSVMTDFTLTIILNLMSFIGIVLLLLGVNPVISESLIAFGLFAFTLQILFHKV
jgi:hypothetical protein